MHRWTDLAEDIGYDKDASYPSAPTSPERILR
jgi:hypothetical protein